jgi:hypothetical protein
VRPQLDIGRVVRRVAEIYVEQASVLMPAAAVVFVFTGIVAGLLVVAAPSLVVVALVIDLVAETLFTGMIVELVADLRDGRRDASVGSLLRAAAPVLGQLILVGIVAAIGVVIGFVFVIVPGLYLLTVWSVAAPVVVLERPPGLGALGRSRKLVRGNAWRVFGVILLLFVAVAAVAGGIELAAESAGTGVGLAVRVVVGVLVAPISALAQAVLYFELRGTATQGDPEPPAPVTP